MPPAVEAELDHHFELIHEPTGANGLVTLLTETVGAELMEAAGPALRVIANYAVGHDNGRIGREVAGFGRAFGMRVVHTSRTGGLPLRELLAAADIVSLHCPLTEETHHLIDAGAIAAMKPSGFLVNTARGAIVDERALAVALREGRLAGAALDVFEQEPDVFPQLLELENVVLTPHLGSATLETRTAMGMVCVEALRAVLLENRRPDTAIS